MTTPHKSEDYKISAVKHYLTSGKSQEEICDIFKCSARSLMRWVDRFKTEKSVKRHNRSPIAYKVKQEHIKVILEELKRNKTIIIEDLLTLLLHCFPELELSRRHLVQIVHDNNF